MNSKAWIDLIEVLGRQEDLISKQKEAIETLVNENMEQESIINEFLKDQLE